MPGYEIRVFNLSPIRVGRDTHIIWISYFRTGTMKGGTSLRHGENTMPSLDDRRTCGPKLIALARDAVNAVESVLHDAIAAVRGRIRIEERVAERSIDRWQRATHGLAWLAVYVEAIRQLCAFAERL